MLPTKEMYTTSLIHVCNNNIFFSVLYPQVLLDKLSNSRVKVPSSCTKNTNHVAYTNGILAQNNSATRLLSNQSSITYFLDGSCSLPKFSFTISFWIMFLDSSDTQIISTKPANDILLKRLSTGQVEVSISPPVTPTLSANTTSRLQDHYWYFISLIFDKIPTVVQLWINNHLDIEISGPKHALVDFAIQDQMLQVGNGQMVITCLQVFDAALSRRRIAAAKHRCLRDDPGDL